jgi:predicted ATP-dependent endonuclease of OLD family
MILNEIEFVSFRSLVNQKLRVTEKCHSLIGLNESGKSNILTAIRAFSGDYECLHKDGSKISGKYPSIIFHMTLSVDESARAKEAAALWFISNTQVDFKETFKKGFYPAINIEKRIGIDEDGDDYSYYNFDTESQEPFPHLMVLKSFLKTEQIKLKGRDVASSIAKIVYQFDLEADSIEKYEYLTSAKLGQLLEKNIEEFLFDIEPNVIYWEYDKKYLIPSDITYDELIAMEKDSTVSKPLLNIFKLANMGKNKGDLGKRIDAWKNDSGTRRKDAEILNKAVNAYIGSIWVEYDQEFVISLESTALTVHISDPKSPTRNFYTMAERSQGFKTFISFLLTISAEAHVKAISNCILLLDEPETHMHPSGVRFMRDELFKLSNQGNYVFLATHSIFMIDRKKLDRHILIKKEWERTSIVAAKLNTITQEALLYSALGTSLDDFSMNPSSILFEGELDRFLFEVLAFECHTKVQNPFQGYALLDGGGTKKIKEFLKQKLLPRDAEWILVLDSDSPGKGLETDLQKLYGEIFSKTFHIKFYDKKPDVEVEDLLPLEMVLRVAKKALETLTITGCQDLVLTSEKPVGPQLSEYKNRNGFTPEQQTAFEIYFKQHLFEIVSEKVTEILSTTARGERLLRFKEAFPLYSEFAISLFPLPKKTIKSPGRSGMPSKVGSSTLALPTT